LSPAPETAGLPKGSRSPLQPAPSRHRPPRPGDDFPPLYLPVTKRQAPSAGPRTGPRATSQQRKGKKHMSNWMAVVRRFVADESGPTAVEYAVMLALIIVVC